MKKIFFFCLFLLLPLFVHAGSIKELEVENGVLSRKFEPNNNIYSILLNEGEEEVKLNYKLEDENAKVKINNKEYQNNTENKTELVVENSDGTKETYTFFVEKETTTPVFQELPNLETASIQKEIPHLIVYVVTGCTLIIILLFKCIVIGFKKH